MSSPADGPALRYYRSLVGRWSGDFTLAVTDPAALAALPWRVRAMGLFARLDGRLRMATTLAEVDARTFAHTTRVTKWSVVVLQSEETITLADDGWRLRMAGVQRPRGAPVEPYAGDGEIAPGGDAATYAIQWAGAPMTQRTHVVAEGLRLTQETAWSRASVVLRRRPG